MRSDMDEHLIIAACAWVHVWMRLVKSIRSVSVSSCTLIDKIRHAVGLVRQETLYIVPGLLILKPYIHAPDSPAEKDPVDLLHPSEKFR
jgi:hypothetical protein